MTSTLTDMPRAVYDVNIHRHTDQSMTCRAVYDVITPTNRIISPHQHPSLRWFWTSQAELLAVEAAGNISRKHQQECVAVRATASISAYSTICLASVLQQAVRYDVATDGTQRWIQLHPTNSVRMALGSVQHCQTKLPSRSVVPLHSSRSAIVRNAKRKS